MGSNSVNKLEALGLIAGPVLALAFFLLEPGALLIDPAPSGDAEGIITAVSSNATLSRVAALMVPLGLVLMVYGLTGISRVMHPDSTAAALSRLGILCMNVGAFGWIITSGLLFTYAKTPVQVEQALQSAVTVYQVDSGLGIVSSMAVASGFLAFNLGLSALYTRGITRVSALAVAIISLVSLVSLIIGHGTSNPTMITVSRLCYFPWVIWSAVLGVRLLQGRRI